MILCRNAAERQTAPRARRARPARRGAEVPREKQGAGQALRARAHRTPLRRGLVRRGRFARQCRGGRSRRGRRRDRYRHDRRACGRRDGQRLDDQSGLLGQAHRREDPAHSGDGVALVVPALLSRRFRRRSHHRSGGDVSGTARRRADFLQSSRAQRSRPADLPLVRTVRRQAARTFRRSATLSSWSMAMRACTWARRAWPRW